MDWFQALLAPALMAIGGIIIWFIKSRYEELRTIEERLSDKRREVYSALLSPYIKLFASLRQKDQEKKKNQALEEMNSEDYMKTIYRLGFIGSDGVVLAHNSLKQYINKLGSGEKQDVRETVKLFGSLRLEIRKSLGNKGTKLSAIDMLRGEIKDIDSLFI